MGDIADSMIHGDFCALCGVLHEEGDIVWIQANPTLKGQIANGYPVICNDCKE